MNANPPIILLIEDERQMRRFLRVTLQTEGYGVIEADTAADGLSQAAMRNPDIILLDLGLPDMDGLDLIERIREWSATPVIVISAREQEGDKIKALDHGADDYLTKPFGAGELLARIRKRSLL
jgi:two-component system KDP operon response regulator KdpE